MLLSKYYHDKGGVFLDYKKIDDFDNLDDYLAYLDDVIKKENNNSDDGESKSHETSGRNSHNNFDLDI